MYMNFYKCLQGPERASRPLKLELQACAMGVLKLTPVLRRTLVLLTTTPSLHDQDVLLLIEEKPYSKKKKIYLMLQLLF